MNVSLYHSRANWHFDSLHGLIIISNTCNEKLVSGFIFLGFLSTNRILSEYLTNYFARGIPIAPPAPNIVCFDPA